MKKTSYFKISKMSNCTIEDGESPSVEIAGEEGCKYILAFDPSWSESEASDDFAIQVIKLLPEEKKGVLVHSYALPGTNLKKHITYFKYILDHFNIVMIVGDYNGGVQFINSCNESDIFKKEKVDILFEVIGQSDGVSKKLVETALKNKIHVITPNKALISKHGNNLAKLAEKNNVNLEFEASVAGGIPILRSIKEGLATNKLSKVYGILNGTSNYILSNMDKDRKSFNDVLNDAKNKGYAESNPISDLNGDDVASKLKILSSLCFNSFSNSDDLVFLNSLIF